MAADHHIYRNEYPGADTLLNTYTNGTGNLYYTAHGSTGVALNNDLIRRNASGAFARVNNIVNTIGPIGGSITGTVTFPPGVASPQSGNFEDDIDLSTVSYEDFIVFNGTDLRRITDGTLSQYYYVLTLTTPSIQGVTPITINLNDWYYIYRYSGTYNLQTSGQASATQSGYIWDDNNAAQLSTVVAGDFVLIQSPLMRITSTAHYVEVPLNPADPDTITVASGNNYYIFSPALAQRFAGPGSAEAGSGLNLLIDNINLTTASVVAGDWVFVGGPLTTIQNITADYFQIHLTDTSLSVTTTSNYYIWGGSIDIAGTADANLTGYVQENYSDNDLTLAASGDNIMIGTTKTVASAPTIATQLDVNNITGLTGNEYYCVYDSSTYALKASGRIEAVGATYIQDNDALFSTNIPAIVSGDIVILSANPATTINAAIK